MSKKEPAIFNDADAKLRAETRELARANRQVNKGGFRGFITEAELLERRSLGLPCDGYFLASQIKKLAREVK